MGWLEGDVALVTGAGSGLGRALVDRFVAEGARVVAADRVPERVAAVEASHGAAVAGVIGDVTSGADNERAVGVALERFGRLDILVGNAIILELKSVDAIHPIHEAQILSYMKLASLRYGFLINFNVPILKNGLRSFVL